MRMIAIANAIRFGPRKFASSAPTEAPTAVATIRSSESVSVAPSVDCITTKVAIAAQYASGICTSPAIRTDTVAATAVRIACVIEGRFFSSQAHSFMDESSSPPVRIGKITIFYLKRGSEHQLIGGTAKSHACAIAVESLGRLRSGHERK